MKGRTPSAAEQKHMNIVGEMACYPCEVDGFINFYISLHHVDGRTKPGAHFKVIPLCAEHHQHTDLDPMGRIGIHPYKKRFEELYGTSEQIVEIIKKRIEARNGSH